MITVPMKIAVSQVEIPMSASADTQVRMSLGAQYNPTHIETSFPPGGLTGDLLAKHSNDDYDVEWITSANSPEQGNAKPITANAVWESMQGQTFEPLKLERILKLITNVTDAKVLINRTDNYIYNPPIPPYSVFSIVEGGNAPTIALTILKNLPYGYGTYGTTSRNVEYPTGVTTTVKFSRPTVLTVSFNISLINHGANLSTPVQITQEDIAAVKQALLTYVNTTMSIGDQLNLDTIRGEIMNTLGSKATTTTIDDLTVTGPFGTKRNNPITTYLQAFLISSANNINITVVDDQGGSASFPSGGSAGDLLAKRTNADDDVEWISPADAPEQDNTRPITAAAVYTTVGNINALLATI